MDRRVHTIRRVLANLLANLLACASVLSARCAVSQTQQGATSEPQAVAVTSGVTYELLGTYDHARLNTIVTDELVREKFTDAPPTELLQPRYAVDLYRVTYPSVIPELGNRPTIASGLLAIPRGAGDTLSVVSYQHGTVFSKTAVPSFPEESMETRLVIAQFASRGCVVVAADYFGKGLSTEPDSYLVKNSTQQACLDMLGASGRVLLSMKITPRELFLLGWSQGGWATLVFLEKLEEVGIAVSAAATASAPADVYLAVQRWVNNPQPIDAIYLPGVLALQILAYEHYSAAAGFADHAIRAQYIEACRDLHANRIDWTTFRAKTPALAKDLLRPEFIASGMTGDQGYWHDLQEEHGYRWRSHTPLRCYFGEKDEVVPPAIAKLPEQYHAVLGGGPTRSIAAGAEADHRATFLFSVHDASRWFEALVTEHAARAASTNSAELREHERDPALP